MEQSGSRSVVLIIVALVLASLPGSSVAYSSMGPYELMLMADRADHLVVGEVVGTEESDSAWGNRVSLVRVDDVLLGPAAEGDTFSIYWRTRYRDHGDGRGSIVTEPGPQLSDAVGPHVWLLFDIDGELRCSGYPIRLSRASRPRMAEYLAWAETPRQPYAGAISDPEKARESGYDPQTGDTVLQVLAAYLAGYLQASGPGE